MRSKIIIVALLLLSPQASFSAKGDCGQPSSDSPAPTTSDALFILGAAVGSRSCPARCVCDTDANGATTAGDALRTLKAAVMSEPLAGCVCPHPPCSSGVLTTLAESSLDIGWNGSARALPFMHDGAISFEIVRRCADSPESICTTDADCAAGRCRATCDCDDPNDSVCEIASPAPPPRCLGSLEPCQSNADCASFTGPCERAFGPPRPISAANTPTCVFPFFSGDVIGTVDVQSGEAAISFPMRWANSLGLAQNRPCPRCGRPDQVPKVGDTFACEGGLNDGNPCMVEAVTKPFGGTSSACAERLVRAVGTSFLANSRFELTTGTRQRAATVPCIVSGRCIDDC